MATAFVTGGSRGIGAACVRLLAREMNVAFTFNASEDAARALCGECGGSVLAVKCDVASPSSVAEAAKQVRARFGGVDMLVNCAGVSLRGLFQDTTDEEWRRVFAVNSDGAFNVTREFLPAMIAKKRGSIVNVSSMWGVTGASCEVAYSASKAALIGMTRALAKEVAPSNIRVNAVAPGLIETEMVTEEVLEHAMQLIPMRRIGKPEEVAGVVSFLMSEAASYVTRQVIGVNGGLA